jgi:hypothetical protein
MGQSSSANKSDGAINQLNKLELRKLEGITIKINSEYDTFLAADLLKRILEYTDRESLFNMLYVNKEMSNFVSVVNWQDHKRKHTILYEFFEKEYTTTSSSTLLEMIFKLSLEPKREMIESFFNRYKLLTMNVKQSVTLKCMIPEQNFNADYVSNFLDDDETIQVKVIFRERKLHHTIQDLLVPEGLHTTLFEDFTGIGYRKYDEQKRTFIEPNVEIYPALLYGPILIELDACGLCIPKICLDDYVFSKVADISDYMKNGSHEQFVQFISKYNRDQLSSMKHNWSTAVSANTKNCFLLGLAKHIKLEIQPVYKLLVTEYSVATNPFFESRGMIYPVSSTTELEELKDMMKKAGMNSSTALIKYTFKSSQYYCIRFETHKEFDILIYQLLEQRPMLGAIEMPDSSIIENFDAIWNLRYNSHAVFFNDNLKCTPHSHCRNISEY